LEIARAVLDNRIGTVIEARADCYSACALIFMAGNMESEASLFHNRKLNLLGRLGFHAPYLSGIPDAKYSAANVGQTFEQGIRAIGGLLKLGKDHKIDLLPPDVLTEMLEKSPDEMFMIDTVFKAIHANIELYADDGISPKLTPAALCNACENQFADPRAFDIDNPPAKCTANNVRKQKDQTWFGPFGAEGTAFCLVMVPGPYKSRFGVYGELVYAGQRNFEEYRFISTPYYLFPPSMRVGY
jgi:hypothetical protein